MVLCIHSLPPLPGADKEVQGKFKEELSSQLQEILDGVHNLHVVRLELLSQQERSLSQHKLTDTYSAGNQIYNDKYKIEDMCIIGLQQKAVVHV